MHDIIHVIASMYITLYTIATYLVKCQDVREYIHAQCVREVVMNSLVFSTFGGVVVTTTFWQLVIQPSTKNNKKLRSKVT